MSWQLGGRVRVRDGAGLGDQLFEAQRIELVRLDLERVRRRAGREHVCRWVGLVTATSCSSTATRSGPTIPNSTGAIPGTLCTHAAPT